MNTDFYQARAIRAFVATTKSRTNEAHILTTYIHCHCCRTWKHTTSYSLCEDVNLFRFFWPGATQISSNAIRVPWMVRTVVQVPPTFDETCSTASMHDIGACAVIHTKMYSNCNPIPCTVHVELMYTAIYTVYSYTVLRAGSYKLVLKGVRVYVAESG